MLEIRNTTKYRLPKDDLALLTEKFLERYKFSNRTVSLAIVSDRAIRIINNRYRGFDKPTDVLSFAAADFDHESLGEIIISKEYVDRQARIDGRPARRELLFIFVHGLLHLAGYDDDTEKRRQRMVLLGEEFLQSLGF